MAYDVSQHPAMNVTCREVAGLTTAYLDALVEDPTTIRLTRHLVVCAGCRAYVKQMACIRDLLRLLPRPEMNRGRRHRVRQAFLARRNAQDPAARTRRASTAKIHDTCSD